MNKTKNLKVIALILLTSAILLTALPNVAAATNSIYIYSSIGGTISADGTALTGDTTYNYDAGSIVTFTATPDAGYKFLSWVDLTAAGGSTNTTNPLPYTVSASGALQAMFIPTTNATQTASTTGKATLVILSSAGGTTTPVAEVYNNYDIGADYSFNAVPGTGFKFLYWIVATSTATTFTTSQIDWTVPSDGCAVQAFFVPTSSTLSLTTPTPAPSIAEYSDAATVFIAVALVAVAFGTYTYRRKAKN